MQVARALFVRSNLGQDKLCTVLGVSPSGYYDWCDRTPVAHAIAQNREEPRPLSKRRSGDQTLVSGLAKHHKRLDDATTDLEGSR